KKFQAEKMSKDFQTTIESDRKLNDTVQKVQQEQHSEGIQRVKDKYQQAIRDYVQSSEEARADFKEDVTRRLSNRESSLKSEIRKKDIDYQSKLIANKASNAAQVQNVKDQMRDSNQKLEEQRLLSLASMKDEHTKDIRELNKEKNELVNQLNRRYRGEMHNLKVKQEENIEEQVWTRDLKNQQLKAEYEERIDQLTQLKQTSEEKLRNYYETAIKEIRTSNQADMKELRDTLKSEQRLVVNQYKERFKEIDKSNREKLAHMQLSYEKKIQELKDAQQSSSREMEKKHRADMRARSKENIRNLESTRLQAEVRLSQLKEQHAESMENLEKRHRREMEQLVRSQTKA
ncbi:MAG: hypothetical protein VX583_04200, partial [Bdellovibrionota bacterium]